MKNSYSDEAKREHISLADRNQAHGAQESGKSLCFFSTLKVVQLIGFRPFKAAPLSQQVQHPKGWHSR
ncbi:hypothetical protein AV530_007758 [Patagioenas fasciata monilis]|uniref:Uncharacterized protein n=1 Tax=Patagioenas fasciata monilis TaxID=372326 RepID=A0A1V4JZ46_PATFA|nr:hypothetical protein AV530_007758 [Patagioenas fasciata monilis]